MPYYLEYQELCVQYILRFPFHSNVLNINNLDGISRSCQETYWIITQKLQLSFKKFYRKKLKGFISHNFKNLKNVWSYANDKASFHGVGIKILLFLYLWVNYGFHGCCIFNEQEFK